MLTALADDPEARDAFVTPAYRDLLRDAYPAAPYGTVLPFRRLFAVAHTEERERMLAAVDHVQLAAPPGSEEPPCAGTTSRCSA